MHELQREHTARDYMRDPYPEPKLTPAQETQSYLHGWLAAYPQSKELREVLRNIQ